MARKARHDPARWIRMHAIYGDLADDRAFAVAFAEALDLVWNRGIDIAMSHYLGS